jgi:protein phosphatase
MTSSTRLNYRYCARTDRGRVRANNEDAVLATPEFGLALLADGMGGYNAGEVASSMAVALIQASLARRLGMNGTHAQAPEVRRALEASVQEANLAILDASLKQPQCAGMGTTLVVGVFLEDRLVLGHIGDSRCYRLRHGHLQQITRDHSWLQEQLDAGLMTPREAAQSGNRNLVTRALGVDADTHVEINEFQVEPQDLFLLCSDGLTDMVEDPELRLLATAPLPLEEKAALMIDTANALGGRDNISVLLVQAGAGTRKRGLMSRWLRKPV